MRVFFVRFAVLSWYVAGDNHARPRGIFFICPTPLPQLRGYLQLTVNICAALICLIVPWLLRNYLTKCSV
jgi:hypothetical protein